MSRRNEDGTVMLLVLGLVVLAGLFVVVVVDASALFMARRDLLAAADGAALAGAQAVDEAAVYREGVHGSLPLDPRRVQLAVDDYLRFSGVSGSVDELRVDVTTDGTTVRVELLAVVQLPVVNGVTPGAADGVSVAATASARSAVLP